MLIDKSCQFICHLIFEYQSAMMGISVESLNL